MTFADQLRNTRPIDPNEEFLGKVRYMCRLIDENLVKDACMNAARRGHRQATVGKEIFQLDYGASFSVDHSGKVAWRNFSARHALKKAVFGDSGRQQQIEAIVAQTIGQMAENLGLNLVGVNSYVDRGGDWAPDSRIIKATFSW